jgi:hypothetical protein
MDEQRKTKFSYLEEYFLGKTNIDLFRSSIYVIRSNYYQQPIIGADGREILVLPPVNQGSALMDATHQFTTAILIRKLESIFTLSDDERQALETLPMQIVALRENQDIVRVGDRPSRS